MPWWSRHDVPLNIAGLSRHPLKNAPASQNDGTAGAFVCPRKEIHFPMGKHQVKNPPTRPITVAEILAMDEFVPEDTVIHVVEPTEILTPRHADPVDETPTQIITIPHDDVVTTVIPAMNDHTQLIPITVVQLAEDVEPTSFPDLSETGRFRMAAAATATTAAVVAGVMVPAPALAADPSETSISVSADSHAVPGAEQEEIQPITSEQLQAHFANLLQAQATQQAAEQEAQAAQQASEHAAALAQAAKAEQARQAAAQAAKEAAAKHASEEVATASSSAPRHSAEQPVVSVASAAGNIVPGYRISSGYGYREGGEFHQGVDLAAPLGTPIHAAVGGLVVAAGPASGFGNWVVIKVGNYYTIYGHMKTMLVHAGQTVTAGTEIALVGQEGEATGPHCHFEVRIGGLGGSPTDPIAWLAAQGAHL